MASRRGVVCAALPGHLMGDGGNTRMEAEDCVCVCVYVSVDT